MPRWVKWLTVQVGQPEFYLPNPYKKPVVGGTAFVSPVLGRWRSLASHSSLLGKP